MQGQGPTGPSTSQSSAPVPNAPGTTPGLTLADLWKESDADGDSSSTKSAAAADQSVFTELAKIQAQTLVDSVGGAGKGHSGRSKGRSSFLDSINVAETPTGNPMPYPTARPASSRRTEDEQIRASRQQRMEEQGLDGSADTGWRTGEESSTKPGDVTGARDFSELLRPDSSESDADTSLSAEQFTMYVSHAYPNCRLRPASLVWMVGRGAVASVSSTASGHRRPPAMPTAKAPYSPFLRTILRRTLIMFWQVEAGCSLRLHAVCSHVLTLFRLYRQKEARERERGADIISSDASYKPAVGTWGVYQRPRDISKAYGGGRTLTPADSATSEEEQAKLDAQLQRQLAAFRRSAGIDVDPETEARCQELTAEGA